LLLKARVKALEAEVKRLLEENRRLKATQDSCAAADGPAAYGRTFAGHPAGEALTVDDEEGEELMFVEEDDATEGEDLIQPL
jgi:hypothetical protein